MAFSAALRCLKYAVCCRAGQNCSVRWKNAHHWLGLDYSQVKYIPEWSEEGSTHDTTSAAGIKKFMPAWNYLFRTEPKKYDPAMAAHRANVGFALDVTEKANNAITADLIAKKNEVPKPLTEQNIADLVKNYDYEGKTGVGMLFFITTMDKGKGEEGAWVTFVDMNSKTLLYTTYLTGKIGGNGFRNHWADATFRILRQFATDKNWRAPAGK
jgi:hypothetical protein